MNRRVTFAVLVVLTTLLAIQAGCVGRDAAARDVDRQAASVEEIILHIEGMT